MSSQETIYSYRASATILITTVGIAIGAMNLGAYIQRVAYRRFTDQGRAEISSYACDCGARAFGTYLEIHRWRKGHAPLCESMEGE